MSSQNPNPCCKCTDPQYYVTLNAQGPQGRQGQNGVDGFSPTINIVYNTPSQYVLSITDINGTKRTPNLKGSLPQGGSTGMVLTRYGNEDGQYTWQNLPVASTTVLGGIKVGSGLSITDDGTLSTSGGGGSDLKNITDTTSGVAITDADSGETSPQTINITTANEDENYSYIQSTSSGSGLSSGIKFNLNALTLMGGGLNGVTSGASAGIKLTLNRFFTNPSMIISEPVFLRGRQDRNDVVSNLLAFDYTHTSGTSNNYRSNGFFIFNKQNSYIGSFTTNGILFTAGDEPSIKFTTSTANNGIWTDNIDATVLTDKTGIQYQALTSAEYTELQTKSDSTIYRLTDTNQVYLGTIPLTGGGGALAPSMYAGIPAGGQNTGHVGTNTVTTYDPPTT